MEGNLEGAPQRQIAAGWYANPQGAGERYWDGARWTDRYRGTPGSESEPPSKPNWLKAHWQAALAAFVAFWVGAIIGAAGSGDDSGNSDSVPASDLQAAKRQLADSKQHAEELETRVTELADRQTAVRRRADDLRIRARELKQRERREQRQQQQAAAQEAAGTIEEDGVWQAGKDFEPGTYRSTAGDDCYWARETTPGDADAILDNGIGSNQTVTINDGEYFESQNCAPWKKIG